MTEVNVELDTRGLNCPLPILKTRKALNTAEQGHVVRMISSDPGSLSDMESLPSNWLLAALQRGRGRRVRVPGPQELTAHND